MAYLGTPIDTRNQFQSLSSKQFNGDGSTTAFTLDIAPGSVNDIEVFVGNVRQDPHSAYTLSGTTLTFTGAPPSGTNNIYVVHQAKAVGTIDLPEGALVDLNGGSDKLVLDADGDTTISADTDDQIDIKIAGADDFQFTANTFTAQSGSSIVVPEGGLTLGSTAVSATAAELNILDGTRSQIVSVNYDISTASGTLAITGAGFAPERVIVFQTVSNTPKWSFGMGTKPDNDYQVTVNNYLNNADNAADEAELVSVYTSANPDRAQASISSWDSDGITLSWNKTGSPTGTAVMNFMFFK